MITSLLTKQFDIIEILLYSKIVLSTVYCLRGFNFRVKYYCTYLKRKGPPHISCGHGTGLGAAPCVMPTRNHGTKTSGIR